MIDKIEHHGKLLAIVIRSAYKNEGIHFFTQNDFSQQLAYMNRPKGYVIDPHVHNPVQRSVSLTQEVLFIKNGKIRVDFYDQEKIYLESTILLTGDVILLASGGHGVENAGIF